VKILLDECVDRRLARDLVGHLVSTVPKAGWAGIKNGALLALAEKEFDAFVTVDRKISLEQDLRKFKISVLLLRARTNRLEDIRPLAVELLRFPLKSFFCRRRSRSCIDLRRRRSKMSREMLRSAGSPTMRSRVGKTRPAPTARLH